MVKLVQEYLLNNENKKRIHIFEKEKTVFLFNGTFIINIKKSESRANKCIVR